MADQPRVALCQPLQRPVGVIFFRPATVRASPLTLEKRWPAEPVRLYGSFDPAGGLLTAQASDLELEWIRYQDELPEKFSRRICNDILQARGRQPLPNKLPRVEARQAAAPPRPEVQRGQREPTHFGSKLARQKALA